MLKIVYPVCCGMDVHQSFVVACIASTNDHGVTTHKSKRFSTFTGDLRRCAAWPADNACKDMCMESTGKYWIPIYNILEPTCNIVLAYPKYVKAIRDKKTDKRDAKWITDIFKHDLVSGSLSLRQIFANFVIWCITAGNSPTSLLERKAGRKTALRSPTSNWMMCLERPLPQLLPGFWKPHLKKSRMFPPFAPKE